MSDPLLALAMAIIQEHIPLQTLPSAVLLDMDGTLFDSEAMYKDLWQRTAREYNIALTDPVYRKFIGARYDQCLTYIQELGGAQFDIQSFLESLNHYEKNALPPSPKPGVQRLLEWLEFHNIPKAVVTSAGSDRTALTLETVGGKKRFDLVITGDDVRHPKPAPEPYLKACEMLSVSPEDTLAIEDSNPGALSALNAGCPTIVVPDVLPIQPDIRNQCLLIIQSLDTLPDWIHKYLSP